jgi:protein-S-isoprenylcysteine O-methyltransferase Ste14
MRALEIVIGVGWLVFWVYWLAAALSAKQGTGGRRRLPIGVRIILLVVVVARLAAGNSLHTRSDLALAVVGTVVFAGGLLLAVWARIHLGRNWGMPMSQKDEPELVTDGPYRFVRHPIYTGILLGLVGTALATTLYLLIACLLAGAYFIYSARVEEQNLIRTFPRQYPIYRARTKMLIPFVL